MKESVINLLTIQEAEQFLIARRKLGIKPGLERLDYLLSMVGNPEQKIRSIHIAGTNGKGSTLTFIKQVLIEAGYRVGSFTSPGLPTIHHHMAINHTNISPTEFAELLTSIQQVIEEMDKKDMSPSEYEILMVITWLYLYKHVDIAVIETCMGGLYDVTNRIQPILTVITTIDYDHVDFLGNTLADIASHKAGIIKKNIPVIVGNIDKEAIDVIKKQAMELDAPLYQLHNDYHISRMEDATKKFVYTDEKTTIPFEISINGHYQMENAANAMKVVQLLQDLAYKIDDQSIKKGFLHAKIPNRCEVVSKQPFILLDGAHNNQSIDNLIKTIKDHWPHYSIRFVFSCFKDKEIEGMYEKLAEVGKVTVTSFSHPRAINQLDISEDWHYCSSFKEALHIGMEQTTHNDLLVITGSLHFVDRVREYIKQNLK